MKKLFIRIAGSACILAALAAMLFPTWVQIDGISRKDVRTTRNGLVTGLENAEETLLRVLDGEYADQYKDDLKDNDLPSRKSQIKKSFKETETLIKELVNTEISLKEVLWVAVEAPGYIKDTENFLSTDYCASMVFSVFEQPQVYQEFVQDVVDEANAYTGIMIAAAILLIMLIILGCAAAVTHSMDRLRFLKYIFMSALAVVVIGLLIALPIITEIVQDVSDPMMEEMKLTVTALPFIAVLLAAVPVVLDIVFERKKQ